MTTYKTARELQLTDEEYTALIQVKEVLLNEVVLEEALDNKRKTNNLFNMEQACKTDGGCGTVACIGGWMSIIMQRVQPTAKGFYKLTNEQELISHSYVSKKDHTRDPIRELFYPGPIDSDYWGQITTRMAVDAIENFLTTGDPNWEEAGKEIIERAEADWERVYG
jgi:hypothetical protein